MGLFDIFKKKKQQSTVSEETLKWDKMWKLWTEGKVDTPYAELMTYQSEINNGGHYQYFSNLENSGDLKKDISALDQILPAELKNNLNRAFEAYLVLEEKEAEEAEEIIELCDNLFYEKEGEIDHLLEEYASEIEL